MKILKKIFIVIIFLIGIIYIVDCTKENGAITMEIKNYETGYWFEEIDKEDIIKDIELNNNLSIQEIQIVKSKL